MSRIYFHSEHGTAELRGSERAYMGVFCGNLLVATLEPLDDFSDRDGSNPLQRLVPPDSYIHAYAAGTQWTARFRQWARSSFGNDGFVYQDRQVPRFDAALNTALAIGDDPVKLMARLHGQCEIHCWVEGSNRAWLAGIMQRGRASGLYRADQGWEAVIDLLLSRNDSPVVCSYSVCEGFPHALLAYEAGLWQATEDEDGELNWDAWYDLPQTEKWRLGMAALRAQPQRWLELKPDDWADYCFNDGVTGLDLRAWVDSAPTP